MPRFRRLRCSAILLLRYFFFERRHAIVPMRQRCRYYAIAIELLPYAAAAAMMPCCHFVCLFVLMTIYHTTTPTVSMAAYRRAGATLRCRRRCFT